MAQRAKSSFPPCLVAQWFCVGKHFSTLLETKDTGAVRVCDHICYLTSTVVGQCHTYTSFRLETERRAVWPKLKVFTGRARTTRGCFLSLFDHTHLMGETLPLNPLSSNVAWFSSVLPVCFCVPCAQDANEEQTAWQTRIWLNPTDAHSPSCLLALKLNLSSASCIHPQMH